MPAARQNGGAVQHTQRGLRPLPRACSSVRRSAVSSSRARGYPSWPRWEERGRNLGTRTLRGLGPALSTRHGMLSCS